MNAEREMQIGGMLGMLEAAFGTQPEQRHEVYIDALQDYDLAALQCGMKRCLLECKFYPTIADIVERIPGTVSVGAAADDAWRRVIAASCSEIYVKRSPGTGSYPSGEKLTAEELNAAGGLAGLIAIRDASYMADAHKQLGFLKRDFVQGYKERMTFTGAALNPGGDVQILIGGSSNEPLMLTGPVTCDERPDIVLKALVSILKRKFQPVVVEGAMAGIEFWGIQNGRAVFASPDEYGVEKFIRYFEGSLPAALQEYFGQSVEWDICVDGRSDSDA